MIFRLQRLFVVLTWLLIGSIVLCASRSSAQDLLGDNPAYSSFNLRLRPYIELPSSTNDIISMTNRPGDSRLYVTTQGGTIYAINEDSGGNTDAEVWFDVDEVLGDVSGLDLDGNSGQRGLQSIAFHPDFDEVGSPGYGKFYATLLQERPSNGAGHFYLGNSTRGSAVNADGVLAEWTYDHNAAEVDEDSYRELFRVNMPKYDHPIKQARFNPYAQLGDEDYGLLYMTHGDSNDQDSPNDEPQHLDNALGKMIRINPLQSGGDRYTIPSTNPFADSTDPNVLKEVYAYGFRNPHTYSFNRDDHGNVHILAGDIGRANVEEVNLVLPGGNYGWTEREGTFVHLQLPENNSGAGYITGVDDLPANEANLGYTYPVAQFDHNADLSQLSSGNAIASGFAIRNGSDPNFHNQFIFANFATHDGIVYHADFEEMLAAVIQLDPDDPDRDEPGDLTQALLKKLRLELDHDNNPNTSPQIYDDLLDLLDDDRSDVRFGEGLFGEMYISSKRNATVYLVTSSLPLAGDFNRDGKVNAADYTVWRDSLGATGFQLPADGNGDGMVSELDYDVWIMNFGKTWASSGSGASLVLPVPEPSALAIVAIGGRALVRRRRTGGA